VPEKELDLLKLAAGIVAEPRTRATKIMWRTLEGSISRAVF
jgi:hypothetical protein